MSPCRTLTVGILAALAFAATIVNGAQYSSNMFLNGDYQNGLKFHPDEEYRSNPAAAFISMLSKRASPFVGQMYLPSLLECRGRQQCVPKDKCVNGYFTQQLPKVQVSEQGSLWGKTLTHIHNYKSIDSNLTTA